MAPIRNRIKKSLATAVAASLLSLGAAGVSGAAGASGPSGSTPVAPHLDCAKVQAHLANMHRRQANLSARVQRLSAASLRVTKDSKGNDRKVQGREATARRNLAHWEKIQARIVNAKFLRREAALAAQAAGQCQAATSTAPAPSTASA